MRAVLVSRGIYPRSFKDWGISVTLVKAEDGAVYFPVRQLCGELGINAEKQLERLNADAELLRGLVEIPIPTAGGAQRTVCLRQKEAAWWLINLDDKRCKPAVRGQLQEIKLKLMEAADRLLFGDIDREPDSARGVLVISSRDEYVLACLDCGARHRVVIVNGEASMVLERES